MNGKVVVVTGASAGIGAAVAGRVSERGASVVLVSRSKQALEAVSDTCQGETLVAVADVTKREEVKEVVDTTLRAFGRIDVWINNVGRGITRQPSELTATDLDLIMQTNVHSAVFGMQEVLPHFRERGVGHVINISSLLGRVPFVTFRSAYCGAKHFLNALTETFRSEVQDTHPDIQFSLVSPGVVRTNFGLNSLHGGPDSKEFPGAQDPEEVAEVIVSVIDSRRPDVYTFEGARDRVRSYYAGLGIDP